MTDTTYVDSVGPYIVAAWLNDVNNFAYRGTIPSSNTTGLALGPSKQGDLLVMSGDASHARLGNWSTTASGTAYTLAGDYSMLYYTHNTSLNVSGNFNGVEDSGTATFISFTEGDHLKFFTAPNPGIGVTPSFNATPTFDLNWATGALTLGANATINGVTIGNTTPTLAANTFTADQNINGLTVGLGTGAVSTNTAIGYQAINATTPGSDNVAVGYQASKANTLGVGNVSVGYQALLAVTNGDYNVAVGSGTLAGVTSGTYNIAVGCLTGSPLATGGYNVYIGSSISGSSSSVNYEIVVGSSNSGLTGKGTNTAYIYGTAGAYNGANVTTWATTSDKRIKQNIVPLASALDTISSLNPVEFDYITTGKHEVGFIAQEYQTILPQQIITHAASPEEKLLVGGDDVMAIQQNLVPYLVKAIQELKAEFDAYKSTHP